jgi:hypothetical protein
MRPLIVIADIVIDHEVMPLAGGDHVVVAVGTDFHWFAELFGGNRRNRRELVGLGFLAAEAAAHAPHIAP